MRIGIDFGTTNSSVALFDGDKLSRLEVDLESDDLCLLPSLIYVDHHQESVVGTEAAIRYLQRETGRQVKWEKRFIGEINISAADVSYIQGVHVMVDVAANGRLLQYIKTALRDPRYQGTQVFDRFYTLDELIAIILHWLKVKAESQLEKEINQVVIGRPVRFSDQPQVDERAEEILYKAARLAGFADISLQMEPIGAAYFYHHSTNDRQVALIFDFGGGTLDLTVAEVGGKSDPVILSTRGLLVGGDDLDREIMRSLLRYFGGGPQVKGMQKIPSHILDMLDNWQTMSLLSRPDYQKLIMEFKTFSDGKAVSALQTLVTRNLGFKLFREIEQAKKRLSKEQVTRLDFVYGDIEIHETITRERFEWMIQKEIELVEEGVRNAVADAGLKPSQIDVVLRTGGTSAVPAFTSLLAGMFGENKLRQIELLTSVVGGLAILAYEGRGIKPLYVERYEKSGQPLIGHIQVESGRSYEQYELRVGARCYSDRSYTISRIPVDLSGLIAIRTAQSDKQASSNEFLKFHISKASRVYVAYDFDAMGIPEWLWTFTPENNRIVVDQCGSKRVLQLFARNFPPGIVALGGNQAVGCRDDIFMNYLVIVKPLVPQSKSYRI